MAPLIEDSCVTLAQKMKDLADSGNSADVWRCVSMSVCMCVCVLYVFTWGLYYPVHFACVNDIS